jgi:hypothetical protein
VGLDFSWFSRGDSTEVGVMGEKEEEEEMMDGLIGDSSSSLSSEMSVFRLRSTVFSSLFSILLLSLKLSAVFESIVIVKGSCSSNTIKLI